jgi:hypothetical protein
MSAAQLKNVVIKAQSITVDESANGVINTLTIFAPDGPTINILKIIEKNDILDGVIFKDMFDSNEIDQHSNNATFEVVSCFVGDSRKKRTVTLVLIDLDVTMRLPKYSR